MSLKILPYRAGSASCRELSRLLGVKRLKLKSNRAIRIDNLTVLNYGNTSLPARLQGARILNPPDVVRNASNKRTFFQMVDNDITVPWTVSREEAQQWLNEGSSVVVRHTLSGHSGEGVEIITEGQVPAAPLYTKYVKKSEEYRVHVFNGQVIDVQRKMRKRDVPDEEVNWQVRNLSGGFIYGRNGVELCMVAREVAIRAIRGTLLDFGAVDILYNNKRDSFLVLEVNTAPGLTGTTLENYANAIRGIA